MAAMRYAYSGLRLDSAIFILGLTVRRDCCLVRHRIGREDAEAEMKIAP